MKAPQSDPLRETMPGMMIRMKPRGMERAPASPEQVAVVQRIALGVFTDMSNAGYSLRETLAAIYLTGAQNAISALQSDVDEGKRESR